MIQSFKIPRDRSTMLGLPRVVCALSLCLTAVTVTFVSLSPSSTSGGRSLLMEHTADRALGRLAMYEAMAGGATPTPIQVENLHVPTPTRQEQQPQSVASDLEASQDKVAETPCENDGWGGDDEAWSDDGEGVWDNAEPVHVGISDQGLEDDDYKLLSQEMLQAKLSAEVEALADTLSISPSATEHLLRACNWNSGKAQEVYFTNPLDRNHAENPLRLGSQE